MAVTEVSGGPGYGRRPQEAKSLHFCRAKLGHPRRPQRVAVGHQPIMQSLSLARCRQVQQHLGKSIGTGMDLQRVGQNPPFQRSMLPPEPLGRGLLRMTRGTEVVQGLHHRVSASSVGNGDREPPGAFPGQDVRLGSPMKRRLLICPAHRDNPEAEHGRECWGQGLLHGYSVQSGTTMNPMTPRA